jgi:hypothetical protein
VRLGLRRLSEIRWLVGQYRSQASRATSGRTELIRDLPRWLFSQGRNALDDETAWITYGALRHLNRIVGSDSRVLEYGSGGSTLYFATRATEVVSVEHDPHWAQVVADRVGDRAEIILAPAVGEPSDSYASTDERYRGMSFREYASVADRFPDGYFDILLIDGRARTSTFAHGRRKVRPGGWIVLDNSDRKEYEPIRNFARAAGWPERRFFGPHPYVVQFGETTIWRTVDAISDPETGSIVD